MTDYIDFKTFNSQQRILELWRRLIDGNSLNIREISAEFDKEIISIKRDIKYIREVAQALGKDVKYEHKTNRYYLIQQNGNQMLSIQEAVVFIILLYNSGAFNKEEMQLLKRKFENIFSAEQGIKIRQFFQGMDIDAKRKQRNPILDQIAVIYKGISQGRYLEFMYKEVQQSLSLQVAPFTIRLIEGIFYLVATPKQPESEESTYLRLDCMKNMKMLNEKFMISGQRHPSKINDFKTGKPINVKLKVRIENLDIVRRKEPLARVISKDTNEEWLTLQVKVLHNEDLLQWILSQGEQVEVLEPRELREAIINNINKMRNVYS